DVITNTTGGLIGLWFYQLLNKHLSTNKLDRLVVILGYVLLLFLIVAFLFLTRTIRLR
ncbi:protein vanZ, partial [Enterococcus faecium]